MSTDIESEDRRRVLLAALEATGIPEAYDGPVWDTEELVADFDVVGFAAPFVVVKRKSDGVKGTLMFTHRPRFYFKFEEAV